ncbi:uncharacterized protein LOC142330185 [Lycorma delicatula]|uniref:uncharacterized protein LOC142330185 n=1 Tax=Lycorma delicatula TaxID=130591 RepID=UPI003F515B0A
MSLKVNCILIFLLLTPTLIYTTSLNQNDNLLEELLIALHKLLNCISDTNLIDMNTALGTAFTVGQLKVTLKYINPSSKLHQFLSQLEELCLIILDSVKDSKKYKSLLNLATPSLWEIDKPSNKLITVNDVAEQDYANIFYKIVKDKWNNPTPEESTGCLNLLLENCTLNITCLNTEYTDNNVGYALTHQVLYWQLFRQLDCGRDYTPFDIEELIKHKCKRILQEIITVFQFDILHKHEDLYLEQVGLCGMENYTPFFIKEFKQAILQLQSDSGCYSPNQSVTRNYDKEDTEYYANHMSSVATLALMVQIKDIIINENK